MAARRISHVKAKNVIEHFHFENALTADRASVGRAHEE